MNFVAVTTFSTEGYNVYGKRMVSSFKEHWPTDVKLFVYVDEPLNKADHVQAPNIEYKILKHPTLHEFKERHKDNLEAHGQGVKRKEDGKGNFSFDAVRFSHKVFALCKGLIDGNPDILLWLDGDTLTHSTVTKERIESWLPEGKFAAFLNRPNYTETGFHMFRTKSPITCDFFQAWTDYYKNDTIFDLPAWTDCHTYDAARVQFDQKHWHSLSPNFVHPHPFINGVLGEVMDHMKGPRKQKGSSHRTDLKTSRNHEYWKNIT